MSGLAGLLAGRVGEGVYQWHSHLPVTDIAQSVLTTGRAFSYLDAVAVETKAEFLAAVARSLNFPATFGANFDALNDALRDVDYPAGTVLLWDEWGPFARADETSFTTVVEILAERAAAGPTPFSVLLRGHGPEQQAIASLD